MANGYILMTNGVFMSVPINGELYHYGVKGMKWGVRRYQNYDGLYTKRGLQRFRNAESEYDSAKSNADKIKQDYKAGTATKQQYKAAKSQLKSAKRAMNDSYKKLKTDNLADKGKQLYAQGKTIGDTRTKAFYAHLGTAGGRFVVNKILNSTIGDTKVGQISKVAVDIGTIAANVAIGVKSNSDIRKLRAYYGH